MIPPIPPPHATWFDNFAFSCLAAFAGLLGYLMRNANNRRRVTWERCVLETAASGFIGFLTVMLCRATHIPLEWMGFLTGVLGWLGATASIQLFERIVRRKLGLNDVDQAQGDSNGNNDGGVVAEVAEPGHTDPVGNRDGGVH